MTDEEILALRNRITELETLDEHAEWERAEMWQKKADTLDSAIRDALDITLGFYGMGSTDSDTRKLEIIHDVLNDALNNTAEQHDTTHITHSHPGEITPIAVPRPTEDKHGR